MNSSSIGIEIVLCILAGFGMGHWLDSQWPTKPYLTILFTFFGIGAAVKALIRTSKKYKEDTKKSQEEDKE